MCAIIDANVAHEVFGGNRPEAGKAFFDWIEAGGGPLVVGGELRRELDEAGCGRWMQNAIETGAVAVAAKDDVERRTRALKAGGLCRAHDTHDIALAQEESDARLLYSNDRKLHADFKNTKLVRRRKGKIYSTLRTREFTRVHRKLLRENMCPAHKRQRRGSRR